MTTNRIKLLAGTFGGLLGLAYWAVSLFSYPRSTDPWVRYQLGFLFSVLGLVPLWTLLGGRCLTPGVRSQRHPWVMGGLLSLLEVHAVLSAFALHLTMAQQPWSWRAFLVIPLYVALAGCFVLIPAWLLGTGFLGCLLRRQAQKAGAQ